MNNLVDFSAYNRRIVNKKNDNNDSDIIIEFENDYDNKINEFDNNINELYLPIEFFFNKSSEESFLIHKSITPIVNDNNNSYNEEEENISTTKLHYNPIYQDPYENMSFINPLYEGDKDNDYKKK